MSGSLADLGPVMQLSFVPADFEAALVFWTKTMGAGPFFHIPHVKLDGMRYRGRPSDIDFSMAIGYLGDVQIELIEQHHDAPSMFRDWRAAGHEGIQHMCVLVEDIAEARARCSAVGAEIVQEGTLPDGAGTVIYADVGGGPGTVMEYLQIGPQGHAGFAAMRDAHRGWDGRDPVRGR